VKLEVWIPQQGSQLINTYSSTFYLGHGVNVNKLSAKHKLYEITEIRHKPD